MKIIGFSQLRNELSKGNLEMTTALSTKGRWSISGKAGRAALRENLGKTNVAAP